MKMLNTNELVFENVTAQFPRLNKTYKFDTSENKTVPCDPLDDGAAYTLEFIMNNDDAQAYLEQIKKVYKEAAKADTKKESGSRSQLMSLIKKLTVCQLVKAKRRAHITVKKPKHLAERCRPKPTTGRF